MATPNESRYASIYIDGNAANDTIANLRKSSRLLKSELDKLPRSSEEFAKKADLLQEVEGRLRSIREEAKGVGGAFSNLKSELISVGKGMLAGLSVAGIVAGTIEAGKKIISQNAILSDSFADVMKTTGLTQVEVEALNTTLSKLNTRTAKDELLSLAAVAGKLGISDLKEVEGFVRAADMIGVALGEDLGGTEQAVNALGKLADIFGLREAYGIEEALLKIGSAINSLGAAGTANEANMIDFANRVAGIAPAANISMGDVLGLAATLDGLGQSVEKSSTAVGQFLVEIGKDTQKFAKITGMTNEAFRKLLMEDANEAFIRILESANATSGGVEALAASMQNMGVSNSGAVQALGALAKNTDTLREAQKLGREELEAGTSVIDEFNTKNTNLAANLEKIWNKLGTIWESSVARDWLTRITGAMVDNRSEFEKSNQEYEKTRAELDKLESATRPLIDRYDELSKRSILNKDESIELQSIIKKLSEQWPIAATEVDAYGNALAINTTIIRGNIEEQQRYLRTVNKTAIEEGKIERQKKERWAAELKRQLEQKTITETRLTSSGQQRITQRSMTNEELQKTRKSLQEVNDEIFVINKNLENLGHQEGGGVVGAKAVYTFAQNASQTFGKSVDAMKKSIAELESVMANPNLPLDAYQEADSWIKKLNSEISKTSNNSATPTTTGGGGDKKKKGKTEAEREAERAKETFGKLAKEQEAFASAQLLRDASWYEKEIAQEEAKYQKQIDNWNSFLEQKGITADQKSTALKNISDLEAQKEAATQSLREKLEEKTNDSIVKLRQQLNEKKQNELQKEQKQINDFYDKLAKEYQGNEEMQKTIEANRKTDLTNAQLREEERLSEETKRLRAATDLALKTGDDQKLVEIQSRYDAEIKSLEERFSEELQKTEEFQQAKKAIEERYANETAQVTTARENLKNEDIKRLAVESAQITSDVVFSIMSNNAARESDMRLSALNKQREAELNARGLTEADKKRINDKYDGMERREKQRAWKAQQDADAVQAGINTALAVTRALPNWINAALAGAAGLAQIAIIKSAKVPQFFHGGYTDGKPEGFVRKPTIFNNSASGRAFSAGENYQTEYVVSSDQLRDPMVADFVSLMEANRQGQIGSLSTAAASTSTNTLDTSRMEVLMMQMIDSYNKTSDRKVYLVYHDLEEATKTKVRIENSVNA